MLRRLQIGPHMHKLALTLIRSAFPLLLAAPAAVAQSTPSPLHGLEAYVTHAMRAWGVPGLALAVVKDDSVVYARGFGVRKIGTTAPVDTNTIFAIGSNTKLFTAVATGMLVDAGRMRWDDRVTSYLPDFQLYDPWVTREITIRDLFTHRSGLGERGNMIAYGNDLSRAEVLRRVRYLEPNSSFRSQFGYQNLMVLAAGEAAAAAAGESWDELVKRRIFEPLGMSSTTTSVTELTRFTDVATPHTADAAHVVRIPWRNIDNIAPAGSINSSASDLAKWVRFVLADGKVGNARLIKPATLREIESPQMSIPITPDSLRPSIHFLAYGLGVMMLDYHGLKILLHTGGIDGMLSEIVMVPERRLGIIVLTNADGHNDLFDAVAKHVLDAYLGAPLRDWSAIELQRALARERAIHAYVHAAESRRPASTKPSLPLVAYTGRFTNRMYGALTIETDDGHLVLRLGSGFTADLSHWANDAFRVDWRAAPNDVLGHPLALFTVDPLGSVRSVQLCDETLDPPGMRVWENDRFDRATNGSRQR